MSDLFINVDLRYMQKYFITLSLSLLSLFLSLFSLSTFFDFYNYLVLLLIISKYLEKFKIISSFKKTRN